VTGVTSRQTRRMKPGNAALLVIAPALGPILEKPSDVLIHATDLRHLSRTPRTLIGSLLITRPVGDNFDEQRLRTAFRTGRRTKTGVHLSLCGVEAARLRHQIRERDRELSNFSWMGGGKRRGEGMSASAARRHPGRGRLYSSVNQGLKASAATPAASRTFLPRLG
jgi:hypothetical protein